MLIFVKGHYLSPVGIEESFCIGSILYFLLKQIFVMAERYESLGLIKKVTLSVRHYGKKIFQLVIDICPKRAIIIISDICLKL